MKSLGIDIGGTSIKVGCLDSGRIDWTGQSPFYARPTKEQLVHAIRRASQELRDIRAVGICVPGLLDGPRSKVLVSVNMPGLVGIDLQQLIHESLGLRVAEFKVVNDAQAAATDAAMERRLTGRSLCISIGTGVGMCVLDDGRPLPVEGDSSGHVGQIDVSLSDNPPLGPDNGAGSLEGYIGVPALRLAYGSMETFFEKVTVDDAPIRALVRAIRICHAIYRPDHVLLLGGVGVRLKHLIGEMKSRIDQHLTCLAKPGWDLGVGSHDFHAALGAARIAGAALS